MLLYGHAKNAYWYGSQLSIEETRKLAPYQNATGLQVTVDTVVEVATDVQVWPLMLAHPKPLIAFSRADLACGQAGRNSPGAAPDRRLSVSQLELHRPA